MSLPLVDRRTCIAEMLSLVGAVAAPSTAVRALASTPLAAGSTGRFLGKDDMALLREMAAAMIPATDTPGAVDAAVPEFIDGLMIDWAGAGARAQLHRAINDYRALIGSSGKAPAAQSKAMLELDRRSFAASAGDAGADSYRLLKRLVFLAYRTSEAAFTTYVPNPGRYRGNLSRTEYDALVAERSVQA